MKKNKYQNNKKNMSNKKNRRNKRNSTISERGEPSEVRRVGLGGGNSPRGDQNEHRQPSTETGEKKKYQERLEK